MAVSADLVAAACDDVRDAGVDDHVDGVRADRVATPASTAETAEVLRAAADAGLVCVARGGGSKLTWGRPPDRVDLLVDCHRMAGVVDHAAGDLIVEAGAGTTLASVAETVAGQGQRLLVDEVVPGTTLGGAVATGASGPRRVAGGTVRDLLIGVTVVRADGVVARSGGKVVKNVAGYDLGKLLTGSFGTLAVVTETVFRLHPLPAARRVVTREAADARDAQTMVQAVLHSQVVPAALEVDRTADGALTVTVLLEGREGGVDARAATTTRLLGDGARTADDVEEAFTRLPLPAPRAGGDRPTLLKVTFALSGLRRLLEEADAVAESSGATLTLRGSAGAGVLHGCVPDDTGPDVVRVVVDRMRRAATAVGGSLVVLDAAADVKAAVDTWGPVPALDLMRRVKQQFDPDRRLAPGRFVGGI